MSGSRPGERSRGEPEPPDSPDTGGSDPGASPVRVSMTRVVAAGTGLWAVALVVVLAVPDLRTGDRSWWPWSCVAALALGALGLAYLSLGRGNAADA